MGILNMLGLMKVEDHKAETNRLNKELATLGNQVSEEKGKRLTADANNKRLDLNAKLDRNAIEKQNAKISELRAENQTLTAELTKFRAQRDKDNAARRERRAKRAAAKNDAAPKVAKKGAGK